MSAFSFTAPFISEEEEAAERKSLDEQERQEIHRDLHGENENEPLSSDLTPAELEDKVKELKTELHKLTESQSSAYREAVRLAPNLVENETDWEAFLRVEKNDPRQAAMRVARYWDLRSEIFGPDLALCSMTMHGALVKDDYLMSLGIIYLRPSDRFGRSILFLDRTRFTTRVASRESFSRVFFYVASCILSDESQRKGDFVLLINVKGFDLYKHFDRILLKTAIEMFMEAIPVTVRAVHMCGGPGSSVMSIVMPIMKFMFGKHMRHRTQIHSGSDLEITESLAEFGIDAAPLVRGAIYNQEQCAEFLKERQRKEDPHEIAKN